MADEIYVWKFAIRDSTVDLVWIGVVLMVAFSFAEWWFGLLVGLSILSIIPARWIYPTLRSKFARVRSKAT